MSPYSANGPQPHAPAPAPAASSSLGTAAVNRNSYNDLPSASSLVPQYQYGDSQPLPSSSTKHPPYHQSLSNTSDTNHLYAPVPTRPTGKFTEEWDASRRGSSIVDHPLPKNTQKHNMSSLQRSSSFSGSAKSGRGGDLDGAGSIGVSRNNTLKKRSSVRRNGSLGRSSSRRSMKAGSVRSLALQSNADEDEMHSAFYCPVPTKGNPTEALANRFQCALKLGTVSARVTLS